jgi:prepilin-type N-terminal cleavage/methylation domain-containing protein
MRERAFSLVEMLTVIMIILIIAAVTFPVFFQVKARAKQTLCESAMHQVYLACQLYENDYGAMPYLDSDNADWQSRYIGGRLVCPRANPTQGGFSYMVTAGFLEDEMTNDASRRWNDLLRDCHQKRGDAFPVAFDPNHHGKLDGYQAAGERVILVRANGSVANVPYHLFQPGIPDSWAPCSTELFTELQH